jgi:hypothetical protein
LNFEKKLSRGEARVILKTCVLIIYAGKGQIFFLFSHEKGIFRLLLNALSRTILFYFLFAFRQQMKMLRVHNVHNVEGNSR